MDEMDVPEQDQLPWLRAENTRLRAKLEEMKRNEIGYRGYINLLVYTADQVLTWQQKFFKGGRTEYDKKKSIEWETSLRLLIDKAKRKNYGTTPPPNQKGEQAQMF